MFAIYPGTFDPITLGHLEIIQRASNIFPFLIVGIAKSSKKNILFSIEERTNFIKHAIEMRQLYNVKVVSFDGLLVDFAQQNNIKVIIRGLRALADFEYEFQMSYMNKKLNHNIETIFLPATEKENFISSSFVKEIARLHGNLKEFVPDIVEKRLLQIYKLDS